MEPFRFGTFPPPAPFAVERLVEATSWIDERLLPWRVHADAALVGEFVPRGFEAYARVFHPAHRSFGASIEQDVALRWWEIAAARGKVVHPAMQIESLIDNRDVESDRYSKAISGSEETWGPPHDWLGEPEGLALLAVVRPFTEVAERAWFMLWDGYGDLGPGIDGVRRGHIHRNRSASPNGELLNGIWALRHYLVFRGPLDGLHEWYRWRSQGPNYWWPEDQTWIVVTEIDGFSTFVGGPRACIDEVLASPRLEALPIALTDRFDMGGDTINGPPLR